MRKKQDRKRRIIMSAIKVFARNGYERTTISDIASLASVSVGNIYQYFKDKMELFESCAEYIYSTFISGFIDIIGRSKNKIKDLILYSLRFFKKNKGYAKLLLVEGFNFAIRYKNSKLLNMWHGDFISLIIDKLGNEINMVTKSFNKRIYVMLLLGSIEHIVVEWLFSKQAVSMSDEELTNELIKIINPEVSIHI